VQRAQRQLPAALCLPGLARVSAHTNQATIAALVLDTLSLPTPIALVPS
jgi:hypothetical protein